MTTARDVLDRFEYWDAWLAMHPDVILVGDRLCVGYVSAARCRH